MIIRGLPFSVSVLDFCTWLRRAVEYSKTGGDLQLKSSTLILWRLEPSVSQGRPQSLHATLLWAAMEPAWAPGVPTMQGKD